MVTPVTITNTFSGDISAANYVNAAALDTQLTNLATTINSEIAERQRTVRDGSGLAAQVVRFPSLHPEVTAAITAGGVIPKQAAAVVSTANVGSLSGLLTIDGYTLLANDRVLLVGQASAINNGLWVAAAGAWTRPSDSANAAALSIYSFVTVIYGTSQAGSAWYLSAASTVNLTAQNWLIYSSGGILPIVRGGTGASDAATARANLGLGSLAVLSSVTQAQLASDVQYRVDTIAALKALTVTYNSVLVLGYYTAGDGGGGIFRWNSSDTTADNLGTVIIPNSAPGTGRWNRVYSNSKEIETKWFGARGDNSTDDLAAILAAIAFAGNGGAVIIRGVSRIASTLTISTRTSLWCPTANDAIRVDVGAGNNGIVYAGLAAGISGLNIQLNVYGGANSCLNAVFLTRVDRSRIFLDIYAGAVLYGVVLDGALINHVHVESTVNKTPPIGSLGFQTDHILVQKNLTYGVGTNANIIYVNLEGARHGIVATAESGEGNNEYTGTIEGVTGKPMNFATQSGVTIRNMHLEANGDNIRMFDVKGLKIGPGVLYSGTFSTFALDNCANPVIDGLMYGTVTYVTVPLPVIRQAFANDTSQYGDDGFFNSAEVAGPVGLLSTGGISVGGAGRSTIENLFHNPFLDIWTNGAASAPDGATLVNCTAARSAVTPFPGCNGLKGIFTITAAGATSGVTFAPRSPHANRAYDRWTSFSIAVYVATGQPSVQIYINTQLYQTVTVKDAWFVVRGGALLPSGQAITLQATCYNSGFVTGVFSIGGVNIVDGTLAPKHFGDHGKRLDYIVTSVANTPAFMGQKAYISGTGKWYLAAAATAPADWIILN